MFYAHVRVRMHELLRDNKKKILDRSYTEFLKVNNIIVTPCMQTMIIIIFLFPLSLLWERAKLVLQNRDEFAGGAATNADG